MKSDVLVCFIKKAEYSKWPPHYLDIFTVLGLSSAVGVQVLLCDKLFLFLLVLLLDYEVVF